MAVKDCLVPKEEQLYMLELLVDSLDLSPEKMKNIGTTSLCVRIEFIDFPPFEISQEEFVSIKKLKEKEVTTEKDELKPKKNGPMDFSAGKSCLFTKQPRDLLLAMQTQPLKIGVYQISSQRVPGVVSDYGFVCKAQIPLSGCLCDQVSMAMNDEERLPKPYMLKNVYNLTDNLEKLSGTVAITLRLSCFGKSIVTPFAFQEKSFIFKSSRFGQEFQCTRIPTEDAAEKSSQKGLQGNEDPEKPGSTSLPELQDVIGLTPACQKLINVEGGPANIRPPLQLPTPPPRVSMDDPAFEKLTNAEKLNDRRYRSLVYRAYPNEPTCSCGPADNRPKPSTIQHSGCIGSGCTGSCCTRLRQPTSLQLKQDNVNDVTIPCAIPSRCTKSHETNMVYNSSQRGVIRMRGGGCDKIDSTESRVFGFNPVRYDNEYGTTTRSSEMPFSNACEPRGTSAMPGCCCPGKEMANMASKQQSTSAVCTKKPCMGVDCLIRAFKNAQEFVDSLGKVSGLADLGLMDPLESPYFGRVKDQYADVGGQRKGPTLPPQVVHTPSPQYAGPGNTQTPRQPTVAMNSAAAAVAAVPLSSATPFTIAVQGRTGVVREAVPILPEVGSIVSAKPKKKDERADKQKELETSLPLPPEIELGPCGEPKCKSRRKKALVEMPATTEVEESTSRKREPASQVKPMSGVSSKMGNKGSDRSRQQAKNKSGYPGPGGDHNVTKSHVKVNRRVMRFVYSAGTTYPGVNYGHKNCVDPRLRVPANMGWLWNTITMVGTLKPRLGWKPGAISRNLNDLLKEAKAGIVDSRPSSVASRSKKRKIQNSKSNTSVKKSVGIKKFTDYDEDEEEEYPPTLHIHRKDGTYYVTMYPIKQETMEVPQLEIPTKPLQFKIARNKDDASVASSSTASDMEIEFSPPAAVNRYHKKPNVIHVDTQVKQQEILDAFKPAVSKKKEKKAKSGKK